MGKETSRERVLKTFNHQEPDKIAVDFGSSSSTGISVFAYNRLQERLGIDKGEIPKLFDIMMMLTDCSPNMIEAMQGDVVQLKRYAFYYGIELKDWKPWTFNDGTKCLVPGGFNPVVNARGDQELLDDAGHVVARMPKKGFYFDRVYFPLAEAEEVEDLEGFQYPRMSDAEVDYLVKEAKRLHEQTDKAVMFPIYDRTMEAGMLDFGVEEWLVRLAANEDLVHEYLGKLTDGYVEDLDRVLSQANEHIDFLRFVDDLGSQKSLLCSPDTFRELIKPYMSKVFNFVKTKYPKQKIALHSCGAIRPLIPELIEMGVDILNPIQLGVTGMVPEELKKEYGKDLVFWGGGCDIQNVFDNVSIPELKDHVKGLCETFAPGGGFLFAPSHNFQANADPERILAVYETVNSL